MLQSRQTTKIMRKYITSSILPVAFSCFGVEKAYMEGSKTNSKLHPPSFSATNTTSNPKTFKKPVPVTLDTLVLLSGSSHRELTKKISDTIHVPICNATISRYSDGEASVQIYDNIRGKDVFIVQPCAAPVNDSIMELLLSVSCAKRANARRVVAVIPYFGYKHHRRGNSLSTKHSSRFLSSGAADFALMLEELGVDRVIVLDLQRPGQGLEACFFDNSVPVENVFSHDILISHLAKKLNFEEPITIVAPNAECYKKASKFQNELQKLTTQKVSLVCFISSDTGSGPTDPNKLTVVSDPNVRIIILYILLYTFSLIYQYYLL